MEIENICINTISVVSANISQNNFKITNNFFLHLN